jgi:hypothetical protein
MGDEPDNTGFSPGAGHTYAQWNPADFPLEQHTLDPQVPEIDRNTDPGDEKFSDSLSPSL